MLSIKSFTFNPFQENTYIIFDEYKNAIVIDPGCYTPLEKQELTDFIESNQLRLSRLINTHCHIDHVLGNPYVCKKYDLLPEFHETDLPLLRAVENYGQMWGIQSQTQPEPKNFLKAQKFVIAGDVLFRESIGRTDLPGGDMQTLLKSIREKLFTLTDDFNVYTGHGIPTTIGHEKKFNPFLQ